MWLVYALLTVVFTTTLGISFRKIALSTKNPRAFAFVYNATMFLLALCLVALVGKGSVELNENTLVLLVISGIGYGLFQRYQFGFRKHIEASVTQTVVLPSGIIGYVLAVIWLEESVTVYKIAGYVLILVSAILVIAPWRKLNFNKYALVAFGLGACLSVASTIDREVSPYFSSALTYTAVLLFFHTLVPFLPYVSSSAMKSEISQQNWRIPVLATINLASLFCLISALQLAPVTKVMPVAASNVVLMAVVGIILLKERDRVQIKLFAALVTFIGLILLSK